MKSRHEFEPGTGPGTTNHPLPEWNADTVQALLDQLNRQAAETTRLNATLKLAEAKNQALSLEPAHPNRPASA